MKWVISVLFPQLSVLHLLCIIPKWAHINFNIADAGRMYVALIGIECFLKSYLNSYLIWVWFHKFLRKRKFLDSKYCIDKKLVKSRRDKNLLSHFKAYSAPLCLASYSCYGHHLHSIYVCSVQNSFLSQQIMYCN